MMSLAEATSPQGTVLGALITFVFYGVGPLALVMYLLNATGRRKARLKAEERRLHVAALAEANKQTSLDGDQQGPTPIASDSGSQTDPGGLPASNAIAPERKEL
ncbi:hypothetical protein [Aquabacterium sp.]|uniref:hypothetical protein n=1 Tax=Aquabacterium sp. TaxID=1872578 RepID=UPI0025C5CEAD|nr:hypothetical protein [Aquabacterium sp.]